MRLSLAGGGTDVEPYSSRFGSEILNFTIDKFITSEVITSSNNKFSLSINGENNSIFVNKLRDQIQKWLPKMKKKEIDGLEVQINSPVRPGSGLGASSAMVVATITLLNEYLCLDLDKLEIAKQALFLERQGMQIEGGFQDQFSASFTGFNHISYYNNTFSINHLSLRPDFINLFNSSLIVVDLGIDRKGEDIIREQTERVTRSNKKTIEALHRQKFLVGQMKTSLLEENIERLGELLEIAWQTKKMFSPRISNKRIDFLHEQFMSNGAYGMKVSGAGGGGHVFALINPDLKNSFVNLVNKLGVTSVETTVYGDNY